MIALGNGQFKIQNDKTGETKVVSAQDLPKYGLSAPQSQTPEDKITGLPKTLLNISQGAGSLARDVGLGGVTDLLGNSGAMQAVKKATGINPLINSKDSVNKQNPLVTAGKDVAGAASFAIPFAKGPALMRLLAGGGAGLLQGASQDNANPGSVGTSAIVGAGANAVLPGIGGKIAQGLGRLSLGSGGEMLPAMSKVVGKDITGNGSYFGGSKFFNDVIGGKGTEASSGVPSKGFTPLTDTLNQLLEGKTGMTKEQLFNSLDKLAADPSLGADGIAMAQTYKKKIQSVYENLMQNHFDTGKMGSGMREADPKIASPLDVLQKLKQTASADMQHTNPVKAKLATAIQGMLKGHIEENGGASGEVEKLNKLIQAANKIKSSQAAYNSFGSGRLSGGFKSAGDIKSLITSFEKTGLPIEGVLALLSGHPLGALGAGAGYALSKPAISTPLMSGLNSSAFPSGAMRVVNGLTNPSQ